jgi:hypothetical protein
MTNELSQQPLGDDEKESQIEKENENRITNSNTFSPTINFNPTINLNPTMNIPSPVTGEQGLSTEFSSTSLAFSPPALNPTTTIANSNSISLQIDDTTDRVFLIATIEWFAQHDDGILSFTFIRNGTTPISNFSDSAAANRQVTTTLIAVDSTPISTNGAQSVEYSVRARLIASPTSPVEVIFNFGLLVGTEIEANNPTNL